MKLKQTSNFADFLNELPINTTGGLNQSQILNYLKQKREQWDHKKTSLDFKILN